MEKVAYLQINDNFYRIRTSEETAEITVINITKKSIYKSICLPTAYIHNIQVIDKNKFEWAIKQVNLDLSTEDK